MFAEILKPFFCRPVDVEPGKLPRLSMTFSVSLISAAGKLTAAKKTSNVAAPLRSKFTVSDVLRQKTTAGSGSDDSGSNSGFSF